MKSTIILFTTLLISMSMNAEIWRVNNNPNHTGTPPCDHCFNDLQMALNSTDVIPGDTIHLEASTESYGDVDLHKPLVIIGAGYYLQDNDGEQVGNLESTILSIDFMVGSSGSTITGLSISGSASSAYDINFESGVNNVTITRCYILPSINFGISSVSDITITKNYIEGAIVNSGSSSNTATFFNMNIANNHIGSTVNFYYASTGSITHNIIDGFININAGISDFYNNICTNITFPISENDNSESNIHNNIFVANEPDWLIGAGNHFNTSLSTIFPATGSPEDLVTSNSFCAECQTGYVAGADNDETLGLFGGIDPYRRAGIPSIPSIYQLQSTIVAYPGGPVNVVISAKTNQ